MAKPPVASYGKVMGLIAAINVYAKWIHLARCTGYGPLLPQPSGRRVESNAQTGPRTQKPLIVSGPYGYYVLSSADGGFEPPRAKECEFYNCPLH